MESGFERVARPESLLKWVNTFEVLEGKCDGFGDLSSGSVLLKCLRSVMHEEQQCDASADPWSEIWSILEEFCNSSLTKVISLNEVQAGNEEHIARVVVLLLCFAVQKKPNEDIIRGITSLDQPSQWDIMFFIESALAKVKNNDVATGAFTSGIGERLPSYEDQNVSVDSLSQPATPIVGADCSFTEQQPVRGEVYKFTPAVGRSSSKKVLFYEGLDSPAGALWLKSPAITKSLLKKSSTSSRKIFKPADSEGQREEVCVLKHHIRVLKNTIDNQTNRIKLLQNKLEDQDNLLQECSAQLVAKTEEHSSLESSYHKLQDKLQQVEEMKDLQDELDQRNEDLKRAEKSLARYQAEVESLQGYKKKSLDLEEQLEQYAGVEARAREYEQRLDQVNQSLVEASSANKRLELELKTTGIEVQAKSSEMGRLLDQNKEMALELKEWSGRCQLLEEMRDSLQSSLEAKTEAEQSLSQENRKLTTLVETLQGDAMLHQSEVDTLKASLKSLEGQHQAASAQYLEYKVQVEELLEKIKTENEQLKTRAAILEGNLEAEQFERKELLAKREQEMGQLKASLLSKEVEFSKYKEESEAYSASLDHEKQLMVCDVATKDSALAQLAREKEIVEGKLAAAECDLEELKSVVAHKEDLLSSLDSDKTTLEEKLARLGTELQTQTDLCTEKETALVDLQTQLTAKEDTISTLNSKVASLEEKLLEHSEALAAREKETATITSRNDNLLTTLTTTQQELGKSKDEISSQSVTLSTLTKEKSILQEQLNKLNSDVIGLQDDLAKDGKALEESRQRLADKEALIVTMTTEKDHLEEELCALQQQCEESSQQGDVLQEDLERVRSALAAKEEDFSALATHKSSLEEQLTVVRADFTARVEELERTATECRGEVAVKESALSSLTSERDALKEEVLSLEREYRSKKETHSAVLALNKQRVTDLLNQVDNLKEELEDLSQSRDKFKELYQQAASELDMNQKQFAAQIETLMEQNQTMQAEREQAYKQLTKDNHDILQKQNRLYEELDEISKREEEAISVAREYEEAWNKERAVSQSLRTTIKDLQSDLKEKDELDCVVEELQLELEGTQKRLVKEQKHLAAVVTENKSLEAQLDYATRKLRENEKSQAALKSPPVRPSTSRRTRYEPRSTDEDEHYTYTQNDVVRGQSAIKRGVTSSLPLFQMEDSIEDSDGSDRENTQPGDNDISTSSVRLSMLTSATSSKLGKSRCSSWTISSSKPEEGKQDRITELQMRNALALPHLKTSYPIETQVQPESMNATNELIKNGKPRAAQKKGAARQTNRKTSTKPPPRPATAFEISLDTVPEMKPINTRKRAKEKGPCFDRSEDDIRSPAPSRRRISAPPTPQSYNDVLTSRPSAKELRRNTMAPSSFKLREFLDEKPPPLQQTGSAFTVDISPPKRRRIPKRLLENKPRMSQVSNGSRQAAIAKRKAGGPTGGAAGRPKTVLKAKN